MLPSPTAPKCSMDNLPIRAVSTADNSGTEILLRILGIASRNISLFIGYDIIGHELINYFNV